MDTQQERQPESRGEAHIMAAMIREIHEAVQQGISPIEIDLESPERKHCFERLKSEYKAFARN